MKKEKLFHSFFRIVLNISGLVVFALNFWNFSLSERDEVILFFVALAASIAMGFMTINAGKGAIELSDAIIGFLFLQLGVAAATVFAAFNYMISGIINEKVIAYQKDKSKKYFNTSMFIVVTYLAGGLAKWFLDYMPMPYNFARTLAYTIVFVGVFLLANIIIVKTEYSLMIGRNYRFDEDSIKLLLTNFVVSSMVSASLYLIKFASGILGSVLVLGTLMLLHYCFYIFRKLQTRSEAIKGLLDITSNIVKYGDFRDKCKHLIVTLKEIIPYNLCAVYTFDNGNDAMIYPIAFNVPEEMHIGDLGFNLSSTSVTANTIREGKTYICRDVRKDKKIKVTGKLAEVSDAMIFVPIVVGEKVVGLILIGGHQDLVNFSNNGIDDILNILSNQMALAIENDSFYRNIKNKADRDHLTKLFNRRVFDREVEELLKQKVPFSLVMYDLDNFKGVNDTYGHLSGDKTLKMVSQIIWKSVRKTDVPCRYGGEELVILFKDLSKEDAYIISDRIRERIETTPIQIGERSIYVTVSGGVSSYPEDGVTKEDIIEAADKILYSECKAKGKNRVHAHNMKPYKKTTNEIL